ncbi:MAG: hypothetical protein K0Q50_729 [Vampirovibrio sp.]|jgi:hypothetical protein|nr:hypothetical protein [Vampirovibrio sp.]
MKDQPKRPRGRPKGTTKPDNLKHTEQIKVMLTVEEKVIYDSLGPEWVREQIRKAR